MIKKYHKYSFVHRYTCGCAFSLDFCTFAALEIKTPSYNSPCSRFTDEKHIEGKYKYSIYIIRGKNGEVLHKERKRLI